MISKHSNNGDYYSLDRILKEKAHYNIVVGERSNGKTYATLYYALKRYVETGEQMAYIRRWAEDFRGKTGATLFDNHIANGVIKALTKGKWDTVYCYSARWYLAKFDAKGKRTMDEQPFCYGFALSAGEHYKSSSYPNITTVVFDEFLTRGRYLPDEFVLFMNMLSTIIRRRDNVTVFMLANTVNMYSPYFTEMGIEEIKNMRQGTIRCYTYGNTDLRVAVEYCADTKSQKDSNKYFAFNNPKLNMITSGVWELDLYPHAPCKFEEKDIVFIYFIKFADELLQCEIVSCDQGTFTYIHRKTTDLKDTDNDIIFDNASYSPRHNIRRNLLHPVDDAGRKIRKFFDDEKVFYQDNMVGESIRNYILWCGKAV